MSKTSCAAIALPLRMPGRRRASGIILSRAAISGSRKPVSGNAANVMEGPVSALRYLAALLASDTDNPPLAAGEIVTTGTLTRAMPVKSGETWTTALRGIPLDGISLRFSSSDV